MVSITHAVTGAYIASVLPQPWLYIPLVLLSHFVLDYIPHADIGVFMNKHHYSRLKIAFLEIIDLLLAVILIATIWHQTPTHLNPHLWLGALVGISVDLIESTDFFFHSPLSIFRPLYHLHHRWHYSITDLLWGGLPQAIIVLAIILLVVCN